MIFESFPFVVGWELTLACNLRCRHCASSAGAARRGELSLEEALRICDEFPALLVKEVVFTGGEPFLNPNWEPIAARLQEHQILTGIVTNGLSITGDLIARMKNRGLCAAAVSIDGTERVHDEIRQVGGAFQRSVAGARLLAESGIDLTIITSVTGLNIELLEEMYEFVTALGAWKWQLQPLFPVGRGREQAELMLSDEQFLRLGQFIHDMRTTSDGQGVEIVPADSCGYGSVLDLPEFGWKGCTAGRTSVGIMSDGRVKGCLSWPDWTVEGDLRQEDLWSIWFRDGAFAKLRADGAEGCRGACRGCESAAECRGGCQAMSLAATGEWRGDPYCYTRILGAQREAAGVV